LTHETPQSLEHALQALVEAYTTFGVASYTLGHETPLDVCVSTESLKRSPDNKGWRLVVEHVFCPEFPQGVEPETWISLALARDRGDVFPHVKHFIDDYNANLTPLEREEALALIVTANTLLGGRVVTHEEKRYRILSLDMPTLVWGAQERMRLEGFLSHLVRPYRAWQHDHCDLWWYPLNGSRTHEGGLRVSLVGSALVRELHTVARALEILTHKYAWLPWRAMPGERSLQSIPTWTPGPEQLRAYLIKQRERAWEARRIRPWR